MRRNQEYNEKALSGLYHSNKEARTILNEIAALPKQDETLMQTIEDRLKDNEDISRRAIVEFFKRLEDFGVGEFIPGRRGHASRFKWDVDSVNVTTLEVDNPAKRSESNALPVHHQETAFDFHAANTIPYKFQLRPGITISLDLPSDITSVEAGRLCQFIQSLPVTV